MSSVMLGFNFLLCGRCVFKRSAVVKIDVKSVMDVLFSQHSTSSAQPTQWETWKMCLRAWLHSFSITIKHEFGLCVCASLHLGLDCLASRGQHSLVFVSSSSKNNRILSHEETAACHYFPQKRDSAGLLITLQPWNLYPRTDSQQPKDSWILEPQVAFGAMSDGWGRRRNREDVVVGKDRTNWKLKLRLLSPKFMTYSGDTRWRYFGWKHWGVVACQGGRFLGWGEQQWAAQWAAEEDIRALM